MTCCSARAGWAGPADRRVHAWGDSSGSGDSGRWQPGIGVLDAGPRRCPRAVRLVDATPCRSRRPVAADRRRCGRPERARGWPAAMAGLGAVRGRRRCTRGRRCRNPPAAGQADIPTRRRDHHRAFRGESGSKAPGRHWAAPVWPAQRSAAMVPCSGWYGQPPSGSATYDVRPRRRDRRLPVVDHRPGRRHHYLAAWITS